MKNNIKSTEINKDKLIKDLQGALRETLNLIESAGLYKGNEFTLDCYSCLCGDIQREG